MDDIKRILQNPNHTIFARPPGGSFPLFQKPVTLFSPPEKSPFFALPRGLSFWDPRKLVTNVTKYGQNSSLVLQCQVSLMFFSADPWGRGLGFQTKNQSVTLKIPVTPFSGGGDSSIVLLQWKIAISYLTQNLSCSYRMVHPLFGSPLCSTLATADHTERRP